VFICDTGTYPTLILKKNTTKQRGICRVAFFKRVIVEKQRHATIILRFGEKKTALLSRGWLSL